MKYRVIMHFRLISHYNGPYSERLLKCVRLKNNNQLLHVIN